MRILHVIPSLSLRDGGPSAAMALIERGLAEAGVQVTTLATDYGQEIVQPGSSSVRRVYKPLWITPYKVAPGLVSYLNNEIQHFDVVHIHAMFSFSSSIATVLARRRRIPYVIRPLGTLGTYGLTQRRAFLKRMSMAWIERPALIQAAAVHFTTQAELNEAQERGLAGRGVVIPLGLDEGMEFQGDPNALVQMHPVLKERCRLLYLSRIDPKKNLEALIDAMVASPELQSKCILIVAGTGSTEYVEMLRRRALDGGVGHLVVWLGHLTGIDKVNAFATADAFVLPSYSENFGIAAVEALRAGLPCVISSKVAIAEEVEMAQAGIVCLPDAPSFRVALEHFLHDPRCRQQMSDNARNLARRKYSIQGMTRQLLALYEGIMSEYK